jgi:hypothetical protein
MNNEIMLGSVERENGLANAALGVSQEPARGPKRRNYSALLEETGWVLGLNAAVQGLFGIFKNPGMLASAGIIALLTMVLLRWRSRPAAILLLAYSLMGLLSAVLGWLSFPQDIGIRGCLAAVMFPAACFAVKATFKLHQARTRQESRSPAPREPVGRFPAIGAWVSVPVTVSASTPNRRVVQQA